MNVWFSNLVTEVYHTWRKGKVAFEKIAEDMSNEIGGSGEECIEYRLGLQEYYAERSPGSRTPADIYAIKDLGPCIHIVLVSVKSTATEKQAALLDSEEMSDAEGFPNFVINVLNNSKRVPDEIKERKIIVSIGYAGIVFSDFKRHRHPKSVTAYCIKYEGINISRLDLGFNGKEITGKVFGKLCS